MFKIVKNPTFVHDIDVQVPVDGGPEKQKLKVRFKVLDTEAIAGFDMGSLQGQADFCNAIVEGFEDLLDENGNPVASNDAVKKGLINTPYVRAALMAHYTLAVMGAQRKN